MEAVRRTIDVTEDTITGYRLREVNIINALNIPAGSEGVEIQLSLRPCDEKQLDHKNWWEFELYSAGENDNWIKHGHGYVLAETKPTLQPLDVPAVETFFGGAKASSVHPEAVFSSLRAMNFYHGPQFQNLDTIRSIEGKALTDFQIAPFITESDDYIIHPTTLDSIIVASYGVMDPNATPNSTIVPRGVRSMYITKDIDRVGSSALQAFSSLDKQNKRGFEASVIIRSTGSSKASMIIEGFGYQAIPRAEDKDGDQETMLFQNIWEPDISGHVPEQIWESMQISLTDDQVASEKKIQKATYFLLVDALARLDSISAVQWQPQQQQFVDWMKTVVSSAEQGTLAPGSKTWVKTKEGIRSRLLDEARSLDGLGATLVTVGKKLADLVIGDADLKELAGHDFSIQHVCNSQAAKRVSTQLQKTIELFVAQSPGAKVLEVGSDGGATAETVLEAADNKYMPQASLVDQYDLSRPTEEGFTAAQKRLANWQSQVSYKTLDITSDPKKQGFSETSYDVIICSLLAQNATKATAVLKNIKKLLKPNGSVILIVPTRDSVAAQLILGGEPTSWQDASTEPKTALPAEEWQQALVANGFSTPQLQINDCEQEDYQSLSFIMASAVPTPSYAADISIVHAGSAPPGDWLEELQQKILDISGSKPEVENLLEAGPQDKLVIVVAEMIQPLIDTLDESSFAKVKELLLSARGVIWVTKGGVISGEAPHLSQIHGMIRTLKQEDASVRRVLLDFDAASGDWTTRTIDIIGHVFEKSLNFSIDDADVDYELSVKDNTVYVPRIYHDLERDLECAKDQSRRVPVREPYGQPDTVLTWERSASGLLSKTHFIATPVLDEAPAGHVEIEVKAFSLNFRDVLMALGQLNEEHTAHEGCGVITRVGPETEESGLKVGDRVTYLTPVFASIVTTKWTNVVKIPDNMTFAEGAAVSSPYVTTWLGLIDIARLQKGETILVHAATGATGQAAVMLAKHLGAEVYATCGTQAKREFLQKQYGIPADHIFHSRDTSFAPELMAATDGKGVDVIYNSLSGPQLKASWECLARFGRFIEIGKIDLENARRLEMSTFTKMTTFSSIDIIQLSKFKPRFFHHAFKSSIDLLAKGVVKPVAPITTYPISEMEAAMRLMQSGGHMGKIVLVPHPKDEVKVCIPLSYFLCWIREFKSLF